ncbi:protein kinase [Bacillus subtilis]|nr:protein kinase [Bacillus subtilis]
MMKGVLILGLTNKIRWKLGNQIGEPSGFGQVFSALKIIDGVSQNEEYVVKKLSQLDDDSIARFIREVRYLTKLDHPRIVKCVGYSLEDKPYFYAMRKYNSSLSSILPDLSENYSRIKTVFDNILEGLEYLHNEGYYHRDLKPANVLFNSDNDLVLCDLGLCINSSSDSTTRLTKTNMGIGTRFYCSPEQEADLKTVDHRTDIYSFGKMLYEAFTLTRPISLDISLLPAPIQYIVKKSTRDKKENRFESVEELRQHFNRAMELLINKTSENDLLSIINEINKVDEMGITNIERHTIDNLASALDQLNEKEHFHEIIMSLPSKAINLLSEQYPELLKKLVKEFIETVDSQGWPFSYTDTLANKYYEIFNNTKDADIHENLLKSILILAGSHNRWYVMGKFLDLLSIIDNDEEAYAVYYALIDDDYNLQRVKSNFNIDNIKLHPPLKKLFE